MLFFREFNIQHCYYLGNSYCYIFKPLTEIIKNDTLSEIGLIMVSLCQM